MKAQIIKPTSANQETEGQTSVFLAGSIEMGAAEDWQDRVQKELSKMDITIFNPRRDEWDASWEQRETNPEFNHQVNWEMNRLEEADIIFMYFSPETKSPISLLELGVHSGDRPNKLIVCCPDGFWRKGNVEIVCSRNSIPLYNNLDTAIASLKSRVTSLNRW
jgi:Nucleoside 2-deoxyribosyltransferase like